MEIIKDSQSKQLDLESIGIKGAALRHLRSLRFYVPKFTILTSAFLEKVAEQAGFMQKAQFAVENITDHEELAREFARLIEPFTIPTSLESAFSEALRDLEGQGSLRIVARPSRPYMSKVDSAHHLNLTSKNAVIAALREIYQEHFSKAAIEERLSKDLPIIHLKLPVILQVFVKPDVTGIVLPYRSESGFFYITAWKGFGFELDFHKADHYLVNYRDLMLEKFLNNTSGDVIFFEEETSSITRTKILHEEAKKPFLDHDQIIEMCKLYSENASELGGLAIEFKIHGQDVSFISLKDANLLDKAESALEDLRTAPKEPTVPEPELDEPVEPEPVAHIEEPVHPEPVRSEPSEPVRTSEPEPVVPERSFADHHETTQDSDRDPGIEMSHSSDEKHLVSKLIDKYIAINPSLERQFRLLEQDLLDALR